MTPKEAIKLFKHYGVEFRRWDWDDQDYVDVAQDRLEFLFSRVITDRQEPPLGSTSKTKPPTESTSQERE